MFDVRSETGHEDSVIKSYEYRLTTTSISTEEMSHLLSPSVTTLETGSTVRLDTKGPDTQRLPELVLLLKLSQADPTPDSKT